MMMKTTMKKQEEREVTMKQEILEMIKTVASADALTAWNTVRSMQNLRSEMGFRFADEVWGEDEELENKICDIMYARNSDAAKKAAKVFLEK
jgi:hypothetical protein